jgi:Cu+-exporting ATPase
MTCGHCVATVEQALLEIEGVRAASADLATQSALVEYDPSASDVSAMKNAVAAVGYAPRAVGGLVSIGPTSPARPAALVPAVQPAPQPRPQFEQARLSIEGMTCASCVRSVERAAMQVPGAEKCEVNLTEASARIIFDSQRTALDDFVQAIRGAGYDAMPETLTSDPPETDAVSKRLRRRLAVSVALTTPLLVLAMSHGLFDFPHSAWVQLALALPVVLYGGAPFYSAAGNAALHRRADMNTLIAVGTGAAFAYSAVATAAPSWVSLQGPAPVYFETAAAIVTLVLVGRLLEARARRRTSKSIRKLLAMQSGIVRVRREGHEREVALEDVSIGDEVAVRPGERVPVDGTVIEGSGAVDESPITGESVPVDKRPGTRVFSGSLNKDGFLVFRAEQVGSETALSRIIEFVRHAQGSKAPAARLADRIAAIFVPAILCAAAATFMVWMVAGPEEDRLRMAVNNAVSVLIIACPCALGLATPAALAVGIGRAAERGILIRDGEALDAARKLDTVVFDKTGTLTLGRFAVTDTETYGALTAQELIDSAVAMEQFSEHPIAEAIAAAGNGAGIEVEDYRALPGAGASALVNGERWLLGKRDLLEERGTDTSAVTATLDRFEQQGKSVVLAARDGELVGAFALRDTIRPESTAAVNSLRKRGVRAMMISGDNAKAAGAIASQAGIEAVLAPVLPIEKSGAIERLQAEGRTVAMVGDGINDAPALAQADLGIAIGAGTDIAVESAGIVLVRNNPRDVDRAIELAKRTQRTILQNYCWAFGYNMLGVPVAAGALYPWTGLLLSPILASAAMALSSVSVLSNSLRLNRALVRDR